MANVTIQAVKLSNQARLRLLTYLTNLLTSVISVYPSKGRNSVMRWDVPACGINIIYGWSSLMQSALLSCLLNLICRKWKPGQPDNWNHGHEEGEDCAGLIHEANWNDFFCTDRIGFVCEKDIEGR